MQAWDESSFRNGKRNSKSHVLPTTTKYPPSNRVAASTPPTMHNQYHQYEAQRYASTPPPRVLPPIKSSSFSGTSSKSPQYKALQRHQQSLSSLMMDMNEPAPSAPYDDDKWLPMYRFRSDEIHQKQQVLDVPVRHRILMQETAAREGWEDDEAQDWSDILKRLRDSQAAVAGRNHRAYQASSVHIEESVERSVLEHAENDGRQLLWWYFAENLGKTFYTGIELDEQAGRYWIYTEEADALKNITRHLKVPTTGATDIQRVWRGKQARKGIEELKQTSGYYDHLKQRQQQQVDQYTERQLSLVPAEEQAGRMYVEIDEDKIRAQLWEAQIDAHLELAALLNRKHSLLEAVQKETMRAQRKQSRKSAQQQLEQQRREAAEKEKDRKEKIQRLQQLELEVQHERDAAGKEEQLLNEKRFWAKRAAEEKALTEVARVDALQTMQARREIDRESLRQGWDKYHMEREKVLANERAKTELLRRQREERLLMTVLRPYVEALENQHNSDRLRTVCEEVDGWNRLQNLFHQRTQMLKRKAQVHQIEHDEKFSRLHLYHDEMTELSLLQDGIYLLKKATKDDQKHKLLTDKINAIAEQERMSRIRLLREEEGAITEIWRGCFGGEKTLKYFTPWNTTMSSLDKPDLPPEMLKSLLDLEEQEGWARLTLEREQRSLRNNVIFRFCSKQATIVVRQMAYLCASVDDTYVSKTARMTPMVRLLIHLVPDLLAIFSAIGWSTEYEEFLEPLDQLRCTELLDSIAESEVMLAFGSETNPTAPVGGYVDDEQPLGPTPLEATERDIKLAEVQTLTHQVCEICLNPSSNVEATAAMEKLLEKVMEFAPHKFHLFTVWGWNGHTFSGRELTSGQILAIMDQIADEEFFEDESYELIEQARAQASARTIGELLPLLAQPMDEYERTQVLLYPVLQLSYLQPVVIDIFTAHGFDSENGFTRPLTDQDCQEMQEAISEELLSKLYQQPQLWRQDTVDWNYYLAAQEDEYKRLRLQLIRSFGKIIELCSNPGDAGEVNAEMNEVVANFLELHPEGLPVFQTHGWIGGRFSIPLNRLHCAEIVDGLLQLDTLLETFHNKPVEGGEPIMELLSKQRSLRRNKTLDTTDFMPLDMAALDLDFQDVLRQEFRQRQDIVKDEDSSRDVLDVTAVLLRQSLLSNLFTQPQGSQSLWAYQQPNRLPKGPRPRPSSRQNSRQGSRQGSRPGSVSLQSMSASGRAFRPLSGLWRGAEAKESFHDSPATTPAHGKEGRRVSSGPRSRPTSALFDPVASTSDPELQALFSTHRETNQILRLHRFMQSESDARSEIEVEELATVQRLADKHFESVEITDHPPDYQHIFRLKVAALQKVEAYDRKDLMEEEQEEWNEISPNLDDLTTEVREVLSTTQKLSSKMIGTVAAEETDRDVIADIELNEWHAMRTGFDHILPTKHHLMRRYLQTKLAQQAEIFRTARYGIEEVEDMNRRAIISAEHSAVQKLTDKAPKVVDLVSPKYPQPLPPNIAPPMAPSPPPPMYAPVIEDKIPILSSAAPPPTFKSTALIEPHMAVTHNATKRDGVPAITQRKTSNVKKTGTPEIIHKMQRKLDEEAERERAQKQKIEALEAQLDTERKLREQEEKQRKQLEEDKLREMRHQQEALKQQEAAKQRSTEEWLHQLHDQEAELKQKEVEKNKQQLMDNESRARQQLTNEEDAARDHLRQLADMMRQTLLGRGTKSVKPETPALAQRLLEREWDVRRQLVNEEDNARDHLRQLADMVGQSVGKVNKLQQEQQGQRLQHKEDSTRRTIEADEFNDREHLTHLADLVEQVRAQQQKSQAMRLQEVKQKEVDNHHNQLKQLEDEILRQQQRQQQQLIDSEMENRQQLESEQHNALGHISQLADLEHRLNMEKQRQQENNTAQLEYNEVNARHQLHNDEDNERMHLRYAAHRDMQELDTAAAATKIQALHRGRSGRKQVQQQREELASLEQELEKHRVHLEKQRALAEQKLAQLQQQEQEEIQSNPSTVSLPTPPATKPTSPLLVDPKTFMLDGGDLAPRTRLRYQRKEGLTLLERLEEQRKEHVVLIDENVHLAQRLEIQERRSLIRLEQQEWNSIEEAWRGLKTGQLNWERLKKLESFMDLTPAQPSSARRTPPVSSSNPFGNIPFLPSDNVSQGSLAEGGGALRRSSKNYNEAMDGMQRGSIGSTHTPQRLQAGGWSVSQKPPKSPGSVSRHSTVDDSASTGTGTRPSSRPGSRNTSRPSSTGTDGATPPGMGIGHIGVTPLHPVASADYEVVVLAERLGRKEIESGQHRDRTRMQDKFHKEKNSLMHQWSDQQQDIEYLASLQQEHDQRMERIGRVHEKMQKDRELAEKIWKEKSTPNDIEHEPQAAPETAVSSSSSSKVNQKPAAPLQNGNSWFANKWGEFSQNK